MTDGLLEVADELYALPLDRFTPERDARAKAAKGDKDLVAALKGLRKPSLAAWVVNLLVRRESAQVEQVLAIGAALRDAQEGMDGAELRALTKQRRQLTSAVTGQARALAADEGVRVTQSVSDEVEATLTAGLVDPEAARAVRSGLLVRSLKTTGVDVVDVAAAVALPDALGFEASPTTAETPAPPDLHVVPGDDAARRREEAERGARRGRGASSGRPSRSWAPRAPRSRSSRRGACSSSRRSTSSGGASPSSSRAPRRPTTSWPRRRSPRARRSRPTPTPSAPATPPGRPSTPWTTSEAQPFERSTASCQRA